MQNYKQTTKFSGLASAMMLVLNHFNPNFKISKENEFRMWRETILLPTRGSCIYRVASLASKLKIPVKVIVEDPKYKLPKIYKFKIFSKKEIYDTKFFSDMNLKEATKKGLVEIRSFTIEEIKEALKKRKVVLLRVNIGPLMRARSIPDYLLVYGYGNGLYLWNNTTSGETVRINDKQMKEIFEQVKTKCKRDNRAVIFG